jgi:antirestriction protein ArdC
MESAALSQTRDIHREITRKIVAAIEAGPGTFTLPWYNTQVPLGRPTNAVTGKSYRGVNVLSLWIDAIAKRYASGHWAGYRQWHSLGAQVNKAERGSLIIFFKPLEREEDDGSSDDPPRRFVARGSVVFNAAQVSGWSPPPQSRLSLAEQLEGAERLIADTKAVIREGRYSHASYDPAVDVIDIPARASFIGSRTSTPTEALYSTIFHELTHWTGHKSRLDRDMKGRFASEGYAIEELIAELGAAFLSADASIALEPRADHAAYIADWLRVLKRDPKALTHAATRASQGAEFVLSFKSLAN